uniref:Salivary serotonin-binding protein n=1 Tax=Ixodes scapularis TaxID=6945 RepID=Q4PN10_IXOSC|nr:salivary serotonin-binding protein [Ixodes scapularis]
MYNTLLVFASLVAAIASVGSQDSSSSGSPVEAWRTVILPQAFYLVYRSFENDPALGGNGRCVSIQLTHANEATKTTESIMKYWDPETNQMRENNVRGKVDPPDGDTIQMSNAEGGDPWKTDHKFVYSDYNTCDVVVVLETKEKKCELWVKDGYQQLAEVNTEAVASRDDPSVSHNIAKCKEEYEKQCRGQKKYQIYEKATCSSLTESSK